MSRTGAAPDPGYQKPESSECMVYPAWDIGKKFELCFSEALLMVVLPRMSSQL